MVMLRWSGTSHYRCGAHTRSIKIVREGGGNVAKEKRSEVSVKITTQFRSGKSMVYDLSCEDQRLTVEIAPNENDTGEQAFTAAAHARQSPERPSIAEPGPTRGDALRAVGRAWAAKNGAFGFPTIDWEKVGQALLAVRAI